MNPQMSIVEQNCIFPSVTTQCRLGGPITMLVSKNPLRDSGSFYPELLYSESFASSLTHRINKVGERERVCDRERSRQWRWQMC